MLNWLGLILGCEGNHAISTIKVGLAVLDDLVIQPSRANSKLATRLVTDMRHLPYEGRLQRRRRLRADLITAFKIFKGLLELVFPSSHSTRPKRAPLQGAPRCAPPPKEKVGIFGEGCEIRPRTMEKGLGESYRAVEPGVPPSETWSTQLVVPAQPVLGE